MKYSLSLIACAVIGYAGGCNYKQTKESSSTQPADPEAFEALRADVERECRRCHNGSTRADDFGSATAFKRTEVLRRISNGTMPPDRPLPAAVKRKFLEYLQ